jgi:hypothetical protein
VSFYFISFILLFHFYFSLPFIYLLLLSTLFLVSISIFYILSFLIFSPPLILLLFETRCKFVLARIISCSGYKYVVRSIITSCSDPCSDLF